MKINQAGATLTEFIVIGPLIFLLGMTGLQYTLMYNAKTNFTYASYEAARAGAIHNASPEKIQEGLLKGFLPYISANTGSKIPNTLLLQKAKITEAPFMKIEIISPTEKAFNDFNDETLQKILKTDRKVIPNKKTDMDNLKTKKGASSGISISEANVLKLRITYGYKPTIPIAKNLLSSMYSFLNGPKDSFSTKLLATKRIPIVVDVSAQMLSPAVENGLKTVAYNPGNTNGGTVGDHKLPDLSEINLPPEYEGMSREEILEDIKNNGGTSAGKGSSDKDWLKLLIALGVITVGASQMDNLESSFNANGDAVNPDFLSDLNSSSGNANQCSAGPTSYGYPATNNDNGQDY